MKRIKEIAVDVLLDTVQGATIAVCLALVLTFYVSIWG